MLFKIYSLLAIVLMAAAPAKATVPLIEAGEWAGENWQIWWSPNSLLITEKGMDSGKQPLENYRSATLAKTQNWSLLNEHCKPETQKATTIFGKEALIKLISEKNKWTINIEIEKTVVAQGLLERPVRFCAIHVLEADSIKGPELILIWSLNQSLIGLTAMRIPETIR